jgi:hypothetical protein
MKQKLLSCGRADHNNVVKVAANIQMLSDVLISMQCRYLKNPL